HHARHHWKFPAGGTLPVVGNPVDHLVPQPAELLGIHGANDQARITRTRSSARSVPLAVMRSERPTAPTPAGVPVKMRSPGLSSQAAERCTMISGIFQMRSLTLPCCRRTP